MNTITRLAIAAAAAGTIAGIATPTAVAAPNFCNRHAEHANSPKGVLVGTMYIPACAVGPGNGGMDPSFYMPGDTPPDPDPGGGGDPGEGGGEAP